MAATVAEQDGSDKPGGTGPRDEGALGTGEGF